MGHGTHEAVLATNAAAALRVPGFAFARRRVEARFAVDAIDADTIQQPRCFGWTVSLDRPRIPP
jgi:hypothetical protein